MTGLSYLLLIVCKLNKYKVFQIQKQLITIVQIDANNFNWCTDFDLFFRGFFKQTKKIYRVLWFSWFVSSLSWPSVQFLLGSTFLVRVSYSRSLCVSSGSTSIVFMSLWKVPIQVVWGPSSWWFQFPAIFYCHMAVIPTHYVVITT